MAIRNTCYGGTNWTTSEQTTYSMDLNDTFNALYEQIPMVYNPVIENEMENAINIAKLQYNRSLTDITHDYMVVDVFTDSTGYNNTVLLCNFVPSVCSYQVCCSLTGTAIGSVSASVGSFCLCTYESAGSVNGTRCVCLKSQFCCFGQSFNSVCCFCYCLNCCICIYQDTAGCYISSCWTVAGSHDNTSCCFCQVGNGGIACVVSNCYSYALVSGSTWCYSKNGSGICCVTLNDYPQLLIDVEISANGTTEIQRTGVVMCSPCVWLSNPTTSTYTSSELTGHYLSNSLSSYSQSFLHLCCCTLCQVGSASLCANYSIASNSVCVCACGSSGLPTTSCVSIYECACICASTLNIANLCAFCFNLCAYSCYCAGSSSTACGCICVSNTHDNFACNAAVLRCYCYTCVSTNCWCFYCNGAGVCEVTLSSFPNIVVCQFTWATVCTSTTSQSWRCLAIIGACQYCAYGKVSIIPIIWSCPVKSVYYTDETAGTGTRVYNVIDASTSNCIACNVPINTLYTLTCCVCCHRYEIIQCSNAASCIKSYAIAVTKA